MSLYGVVENSVLAVWCMSLCGRGGKLYGASSVLYKEYVSSWIGRDGQPRIEGLYGSSSMLYKVYVSRDGQPRIERVEGWSRVFVRSEWCVQSSRDCVLGVCRVVEIVYWVCAE
jgi:hypothetical protein